jgi:hypothetical protein
MSGIIVVKDEDVMWKWDAMFVEVADVSTASQVCFPSLLMLS